MAVASLVCSCVGIVPFFFGVPCIVGIVLGFAAKARIGRTGNAERGRGLAVAGIVVGFSLIGLFLFFVVIAVLVHPTSCANNPTQAGCVR